MAGVEGQKDQKDQKDSKDLMGVVNSLADYMPRRRICRSAAHLLADCQIDLPWDKSLWVDRLAGFCLW